MNDEWQMPARVQTHTGVQRQPASRALPETGGKSNLALRGVQRFVHGLRQHGFLSSDHFAIRFLERARSQGIRPSPREFARAFFAASHYRQTRPGYSTSIAVVRGMPVVYRMTGRGGRQRLIRLVTILPGSAMPPVAPAQAPRVRFGGTTALGETERKSADYVRWVQGALNRAMGAGLRVDGIAGKQTRAAVRAFQRRSGLRVDGVVGPQTERALVAAGAAPWVKGAISGATSWARGALAGAQRVLGIGGTRFRPVAVESPGGGRVRDKRDPSPAELVTVSGHRGQQVPLQRHAAAAWRALVEAARADGIAAPLLLPTSGYRSSAHQERLWRGALAKYGSAAVARRWVAPPGSSAHQSGRAIDFYLGGSNDSRNVTHLRTLPAYRWLAANARRFGFYPYEREPWHWEYNPPASG